MSARCDSGTNPHNICTWGPAAECADCPLAQELSCRFKWRDLAYFLVIFLPFLVPSVLGMVAGDYGLWVVLWAAYMLFFFNIWETWVLCRHCPYCAEAGSILHCLANYGALKLWDYDPAPMNDSEKLQLIIGCGILAGFPFPFLVLGGQYQYLLLALLGAAAFGWSLRRSVCSRCVHFSCPLNIVPEETVYRYLERNPVIKEAWED